MKRMLSLFLLVVLVFSLAIPASALNANTYTDTSTGNVLTLPAGWKTKTLNDSLAKVTFIPPSDDPPVMQYGSTDLWSELSAKEKKAISRQAYDNRQFTVSDIADLVGTKDSRVQMVQLGSRDYFRAEADKTKIIGKVKLTLTSTYWITVENGWFYIYLFGGNTAHSLYQSFETMVERASYGETVQIMTGSQEQIYTSAVSAYERGEYGRAAQLFQQVEAYSDSSKYLRLIRIRNAGGNIGVGSAVYVKELGLTDADKQDIDEAAKDFYFADTAQVLLCNSDVACYYLVGKWNGGAKCYIHFKMNKYGGTYNIGSKLSTNYKDTFSINDGDLCVDVCNTNKLTLHLTLTAPNCMEVLTYEKGCKTYTLKRK